MGPSRGINCFSIHALLAESDARFKRERKGMIAFLSTLSLRRATNWSGVPLVGRSHFYPRSPCGERLVHLTQAASPGGISIHALLAESDRGAYRGARQSRPISIHALLAESDLPTASAWTLGGVFLSTLSLRRATPP